MLIKNDADVGGTNEVSSVSDWNFWSENIKLIKIRYQVHP